MSLLEGINVTPETSQDAKKLIGKRVQYLRECDIERNKGMIFPRYCTIIDVKNNNIVTENDYIYIPDLVEMVLFK